MDKAAILRETSDREKANEPSDSIIETDEPEINPQRDQPEEVKAQELPEKSKDDETEISDDVIPLDEDVDATTESKFEAPKTEGEQDGAGLEQKNSSAEEIESLPENTSRSDPTQDGAAKESDPITDPFGDQKND